jgi:hypothetical protein
MTLIISKGQKKSEGKDFSGHLYIDLHIIQKLEKVAKRKNVSLSDLAYDIFSEYLLENKHLHSKKKEKRAFLRRDVSLPALLQTQSGKDYSGTVIDISFGGMCITLPSHIAHSHTAMDSGELEEQGPLHVLLRFPGGKNAVNFLCEPRWIVGDNTGLHLGAEFTGDNLNCCQALYKYIM